MKDKTFKQQVEDAVKQSILAAHNAELDRIAEGMPKCCRDVDVAVDDAMDSENWGKFKAGKIIKV